MTLLTSTVYEITLSCLAVLLLQVLFGFKSFVCKYMLMVNAKCIRCNKRPPSPPLTTTFIVVLNLLLTIWFGCWLSPKIGDLQGKYKTSSGDSYFVTFNLFVYWAIFENKLFGQLNKININNTNIKKFYPL